MAKQQQQYIAYRHDRFVTFSSHEEARRFVLGRGDQNELWEIVLLKDVASSKVALNSLSTAAVIRRCETARAA